MKSPRQRSRLDVAEATRVQHRTALNRALPTLGARRLDQLSPQDVADLVADLAEQGKAGESIRKTLTALAMVFDHAGIRPNPARDRTAVKLPREEPEEPNPPTADQLEAVHRLLPSRHRLPFLFLDWSGARVSAIDLTLVGDYDEARRRVRLRAATTKTRRALWVELHPALADAIELSIGPREDRDLDASCSPVPGRTR
jgi:site-specific recombinase XerC